MTEQTSTDPDLDRARRAAAAHTGAVREMERFIDRMSATPEPATLAEYANLAAREEATRADRQDALGALGLQASSIDDSDI